MKRLFEKIIAIAIAVILCCVMLLIFSIVFGGSIVTGLTFIIGFPVAFPLTSTFLFILLVLFSIYQKKN